MATRREVLEQIAICEKSGEFDKHVDPIDFDNVIEVDEKFRYIHKGFWLTLKYVFLRIFMIAPFSWYQNKIKLKTKIVGRENLKGIKSAIITSNHVNMWDCIVQRTAMRGHKLFIVAGKFNNFKGLLGELMRASRMMPLSDNFDAMKNFNNAIKEVLTSNHYLLFYPEQSMWWNYEKPRPYKNGAFHYAVKYNVPIIPTFITFEKTDKVDEENIPIKKFTLNIMKPIYPKQELNNRDNVEFMKTEAFNACQNKYKEVYKID